MYFIYYNKSFVTTKDLTPFFVFRLEVLGCNLIVEAHSIERFDPNHTGLSRSEVLDEHIVELHRLSG